MNKKLPLSVMTTISASPAFSDGRMYCPLDDHVDRRTDGSILALTRGHRIEIGADGRLRITNRVSNEVEFEK